MCNYSSIYKKDVSKHIDKIKKCCNPEETPEIIETLISVHKFCKICNKKLANKDSLQRHELKCKIKHLENKIIELSTGTINNNNNNNNNGNNNNNTINNNGNNTINNNTINNTTINNYITISLTPYNYPNMEGMKQYIEAAIRKSLMSVPNLIESVHFNDKFPENHTICITNKRTKDAKVFDGKRWKTMDKEELISEITDNYERELTSYAEEKGKTSYIDNYTEAKQRKNGEENLKEEIHNVLYDNNKKVNTKITEVKKQSSD